MMSHDAVTASPIVFAGRAANMDSMTFQASRRAFLGAAVSTAVATIPRLAMAQDHAPASGEVDMFAHMVQTLGEPEHASKIGPDEAARYANRVPPALVQFWVEHGRGAYFDGLYWICDPAPFDEVLELIFEGDPEFSASDMTVVAHSAFGALKVWHRQRRKVNVSLLQSSVFNPPASSWHDAHTGQAFSEAFSVSTFVSTGRWEFDHEDRDLLAAAAARYGALEPGEVYGFFPALQLGGSYAVENLKRVKAPEHFAILAQLDRFKLTRLTPPDPPAFPYGHLEFVRFIGPPGGR
jgi:hypothetical protein